MSAHIRRACAVLVALLAAPAAAEEGLFPFLVSYDSPANATNVSGWPQRPAGKHGFVEARGGRLATDAGPIRFWATNLCFEGCFPTHEQAERLAGRLARLGINCVRMHHMDSRSIWGDGPNKLAIDPKKLERLDYLIYQLREHGVYANLNLHVSRWLDEAEGFVKRSERPEFDKGLDNFEPRMIELQRQYARDLLTHVNPYTRNAYVREPAVAFVEISNEDALYAVWGWGQLDRLPEPYAGTFRTLWNQWLRKKYGTTEKLSKAWGAGAKSLGREMLPGGEFAGTSPEGWNLERDDDAQAEWSVQAAGPGGSPCLRLIVHRPGKVGWHPQITRGGLTVKKETPYTLTFQMRSDKKRRCGVNAMQAHDPWESLGFSADVDLSPDWRPFRYTFVLDRDDPNARIGLTGFEPGTYELAGVSLRPGGVAGLEPDQRLEDGTVPVLRRGAMGRTQAARHDFCDFLWDTEAQYWWGMNRFLKEELGLRSLVAGTQMGYSPAHVQARLDYLDAHSYWQHPSFPGRPWDPANWYVNNLALVNSPGGTLSRLAATRVAGMPYTVSEYNHPQPIVYAAEGFPMIAAFGAFQGWDAVYSFAYSHNDRFEPVRLDGFFDVKSDPARLVHMPACAAMFLRGDVARARETLLAPLPAEAEQRQLRQSQSAWTLSTGQFGVEPNASLVHAIGLDLGAKQDKQPDPQPGKQLPSPPKSAKKPKSPDKPAGAKPSAFVSDTGQLRWDAAQSEAGYFTVDAPRTKLFTGFVRGRTFRLGDVELRIGPTRLDWATVSLVALDGEGFDRPGRVLVAATGWVQNTGARLEELGGQRVTLGNRWGKEPILCEGIPAEIVLPVPPDRVTIYPLDPAGSRGRPIPPGVRDGRAAVPLGPQHKTLWYELVIR